MDLLFACLYLYLNVFVSIFICLCLYLCLYGPYSYVGHNEKSPKVDLLFGPTESGLPAKARPIMPETRSQTQALEHGARGRDPNVVRKPVIHIPFKKQRKQSTYVYKYVCMCTYTSIFIYMSVYIYIYVYAIAQLTPEALNLKSLGPGHAMAKALAALLAPVTQANAQVSD